MTLLPTHAAVYKVPKRVYSAAPFPGCTAPPALRGDEPVSSTPSTDLTKRYASPAAIKDALGAEQYIASDEIATTVYLTQQLGKPLLCEGPAGVGKTELAKAIACATGRELIRLQCYEGLDETKALYEWEYAKQMLYTQLLRDKLQEELAGTHSLVEAADRLAGEEDVFFSQRFLLQRPLLKAILSEQPTVLLIDEIDRADAEFEAFLLEVLSDFQVTVPELGTLKAVHRPIVLLTSNNTRELSEALKRRCLYLFIGYPSVEQELAVVRLKVPESQRQTRPPGRRTGSAAARAGPAQVAQHQRNARLGQLARRPQRRPPGPRHSRDNAQRAAQARERPLQGQAPPQGLRPRCGPGQRRAAVEELEICVGRDGEHNH